MGTKLTFISGIPSVTTGSDAVANGPLSPAQLDQNFANVRGAVDTLAAAQTVAQRGTYTPTVTLSGGSVTVSSPSGEYIKQDGRVDLTVKFTVTSVSSPSGLIMISVPFAPDSYGHVGHIAAYGLTAGNSLVPQIYNGQIYISEVVSGNISGIAGNRLIAGATITSTITYMT